MIIKRITCTILISFLLSVSCYGQAKHHNKIDDLNSEKDVLAFVRPLINDTNFVINTNFRFNKIETIACEELEKLADSLNPLPWYKIDFDKNSWTDLLVEGSLDHNSFAECYTICIMDVGENKFSCCLLNNSISYHYMFPIIKSIDSIPCILNYYIPENNLEFENKPSKVKIDTLVFKFRYFINLNRSPNIHSIEKIEFHEHECYGTCPVFDLSINANKTASFDALEYNLIERKNGKGKKMKGKYHANIDSEHYSEIIDLLNYINFKGLKDKYKINRTDNPGCDLIITYDDGQVKSIYDYGLNGTFGLRRLYISLFNLRENQHWKR